jgi:hypothetical protein
MCTLAFGQHEDRSSTYGYEATREAAMAAFANSWRRERSWTRPADGAAVSSPTIAPPPASKFGVTAGDSDFLLITEANDAENIIAAVMAAAAPGAISDMTTARAWTGAEFKAVGEKASKAASAYRLPGKS